MNRFTFRIMALVIGGLITSSALIAQKKAIQGLFDQSNLLAWCIVPFDSKNRTPEQRIEMLRRLGFSQYAYDWRHQHLDSFASEIEIARRNRVNMAAVWLWIDKGSDKPGQLSEDNERMLSILKDSGLKTQLWVGFSHNYFDSLNEAGKVSAGVEMIKYIRGRTGNFVTKVGLYNHGDWFGNPLNQVKITQALKDANVGIVYNFHHAHTQVDGFSALVTTMKPYLLAVNINGMKRSGPQILPVGSGDEEKDMLKILVKSGYHGPIGILGHIETEDVEVVLKRNLDGLKGLASAL
jgi:sugar phosphate isomerase/epimerase